MPSDDGPAGQPVGQAVTHSTMGTVMTHKAFGPPAASCLAAICREVAPLEGLLSRFLFDSEVGRVNRAAGMGCVGGIGKGYAGDQIVDVFKRYGVSSAFSNLGGNVVTWGARPDGSPWRIGIQHPRQ